MGWIKQVVGQKAKLQTERLHVLLKLARKDAHMTQTQAADQLGRDQTFMTRIESGTREVTFVEMEQLARIYAKKLAFFETIEGVEQLHPDLNVPTDVRAKHPASFKKKKKGNSTKRRTRSPARPKSAKRS